MNKLTIFVCFILGFVAVLGLRYGQVAFAPAFKPQVSDFSFQPPARAISGVLTTTRGHVEKLSRDDGEYKEASTGAQILIGESVATKQNAAATITIESLITINFGSNGELVFANLFPGNVVLQQKSGTIEYILALSHALSVRALHALTTISSGITTITVNGNDISLRVTSGEAKIALVDNDNNTHVYTLKKGQRATINDEKRKISISPR